MRSTKQLAGIVFVGLAFVLSPGIYAGDLEPTAAPSPTMKTLGEVEPRIPIHASDMPLTITEFKSYYLVEDVNFSDPNNDAITIECNDVTIDLMGYTLKGPDSGNKSGIYMNCRSNVAIGNGTVREFGHYGIREDDPNGKNQGRLIHQPVNLVAILIKHIHRNEQHEKYGWKSFVERVGHREIYHVNNQMS